MTELDIDSVEEKLPAVRRQQLIDWFDVNMAGSTQELAKLFKISVSTIRRDLDLLSLEGYLKRTHGGAVRTREHTTYEPSTNLAQRTAVEEKSAIINEALKNISPGQSVLIDTGAIAHHLADAIAELEFNLTLITNDINVAHKLTYKSQFKLIVPGGTNRPGAYGLLGEPGVSFLRDIRCDVYFMSAQAVDLDCPSDTVLELVELKRASMAASEKTVLLAESSRFGSRALYKISDLDKIETIITDEGLPQKSREEILAQGIELICAKIE